MEGSEKHEGIEELIERKIEQLAREEEINPENIFSDMAIFAQIIKEGDTDAESYFELLSEKIGIPTQQLIVYSQRLNE